MIGLPRWGQCPGGRPLTSHLALYLMVFGALLLVAVLLDDIAARIRLPGILLVLLLENMN